jgi:hypothetical protein
MLKRTISALLSAALALAPLPSFATDLNQTDWSETDSSNNSTPPNGWPSGTMLPSQVEPAARAMRGATKRFYDHINATVTSGGTANAQTLTYTVAPAAYVSGDCYTWVVGSGLGNTGAATLNVNSLGAKNIQIGGYALAGGEMPAASVVTACYDGTQFQIANISPARPPVPSILTNGAFELDQPNEGASVNVSNAGTTELLDGWYIRCTSAANGITAQRTAISWANATGAQFPLALKVTIGTGNATVNAGDFCVVETTVEAYDIANAALGTANAKPLSAAICLQSSVANAVIGLYAREANSTSHANVHTLTLGAANTPVCTNWVIAADTGGTWNSASMGKGLAFGVTLEAGTNFQQAADAWAGTNQLSTSSQTQLSLTSGANLYITGAWLGVAPVPVPFTRLPITQYLENQQHYYEKSYDFGVAVGTVTNNGISIIGAGIATAGDQAYQTVAYKTKKRCSSAPTLYSPATGATGKARDFVNAADVTATVQYSGFNGFAWSATPSAGTKAVLGVQWTVDCRF